MFRSTALLVPLAAAVSFSQAIPVHYPEARHGLRFTTPAKVWDEALPLGNGMTGALIWGDGHPLHISLDRADLWDTRPVPEFHGPDYKFSVMKQWHEQGRVKDLLRVYEDPYRRAAPTKIPAGRIELEFPVQAQFRETSLTLSDALAVTTFSDGTGAEAFVDANSPVGMVRVSGSLLPQVKLEAPPFRGTPTHTDDLALLGYPAPVATHGTTWRAFTQEGYAGFRFAIYAAWKDSAQQRLVAWSIASSNDGNDPLAIARKRVDAALQHGFSATFEAHRQWWKMFWAQSSVTVPNPIIERQWYLDTYKWGATARRGAPPITLQAVWTADNGRLPPWKGDYHHDLNTELSYWPAYSGNRLEEGMSYLDWLWKTRDTAWEWTRQFFALPGLNVPMTADIAGHQIGGWRQYTHSATTSAWLAHHFYLHWRYSLDRDFLRDRAYPYLRDVAVFLEAFTATKDAHGIAHIL